MDIYNWLIIEAWYRIQDLEWIVLFRSLIMHDTKLTTETLWWRPQRNEETQRSQSNEETQRLQSNEETQTVEYSDPRHLETTVLQNASGQIEIGAHCIDVEGQNAQHNQLEHEYMTDSSG